MKKMLITGASGFLGSRAAKYFAEGYEVYTPTHSQMDITQEKDVRDYMESVRPDFVIHCAAMSDTGQCRAEPELSWKRNVDGSIHVAKAAKQVGAKCLLCSSDQVYFAVPDNLYAEEKRTAELEGLKVNPEAVFLRLSWMYDPAPLEVSGHRDFFTNLLPKLGTDETVSYPVYDRRGITDVNEVVQNLEKAIGLPGGVYDFGSPNDKSMYETVVAIFAALGLPKSRVQENRDAFRDSPRDMTMDQKRINDVGIFFSDTTEALVRNFRKYMDDSLGCV